MAILELELGGVTAQADLLEDMAPQTTAKFLAALPITGTLRHVRWSGSAGYILVDALRDPAMALENRVSFYPPGSIAFRPEHGEVAITYGQAQARDSMSPAGWATHVAQVRSAGVFLEKVAATQHVGGLPVTIRRAADR
ncbi:MAG: DUF3830 family protein [Acidimicrobiales bacterium]